MRVLILGGTAEAAALAHTLTAAGFDTITALAGRTRQPAALAGKIRIGGFGGAQGLADYLASQDIDALIDATHPFAAVISANAEKAVRLWPTPRLMLVRPPWTPIPGDRWNSVPDIAAAAAAAPAGARVFLAIGRQELAAFTGCAASWFLIRSVEAPDQTLCLRHERIAARGPFRVKDEVALLKSHRIDLLIARNSGGDDAKLVAARHLGVPVVLINRRESPPGERADTVAQAVAWLVQKSAA